MYLQRHVWCFIFLAFGWALIGSKAQLSVCSSSNDNAQLCGLVDPGFTTGTSATAFGNIVMTGNGNKMDHADSCVAIAAQTADIQGNDFSSGESVKFALVSGAENKVYLGEGPVLSTEGGFFSTVLGGRGNTVRGAYVGVIASGRSEVDGSFAFVGGGQKNLVTDKANFGTCLGSFCNVTHHGAMVFSARTVPGNPSATSFSSLTGFELGPPPERCDSMGDNTVHVCTEEETGFYVNGRNVLEEIATLKGLIQELNASFESILDECKEGAGSRRVLAGDGRGLQGDPCYTNFPTNSPTPHPTGEWFNLVKTEITDFLVRDNLKRSGYWHPDVIEALYKAPYRKVDEVCAASRETIQRKVETVLSAIGSVQPFSLALVSELKTVVRCPPKEIDILPVIAISVAATGVTVASLTFLGLNKRFQAILPCNKDPDEANGGLLDYTLEK